jgi:hypothetical protein
MSALEGGPAKIAGVHHCDGVKEAAALMLAPIAPFANLCRIV